MIAWYNLFWICPICMFVGFILCAMVASAQEQDEHDKR